MTSIDNRVVQMEFNNRQFESGIQTSIKSLDALKKGLNLADSARGFAELDRAAKSFSLSGIADGVAALSNRFSNLGIVGITALQNITNSAVNAGKKILSALTIDPVKAGFSEYETKIGAIQTILTNTASKGTKIDDVTEVLDELNEYSDKTIYNFAEMARNVGTFTAAGVGLEDSAIAIKGISNLAAGSGSNPQQAASAMYQLSQALAAGSVKLMDWNSVVYAGMGGELFQNALKNTAKEMGVFVNESVPFRESLQDGWITSDVLIKTLAKFSEDANLLEAATQVKTFTQLIDTMKESIQSGWALTWENVIGNKEEAAKFFTKINDYFGTFVKASSDGRNALLSFWKVNGGREAMIESLWNTINGLANILITVGKAFREVFPAVTGKQLVEFSKSIKDFTANFKMSSESIENLKNTFKGFFAILSIAKQLVMAVAKGIGNLIGAFLPVGGSVLYFTGSIGEFISSIDSALKSSNTFGTIIDALTKVLLPVAKGLSKMVSGLADMFKLMSPSNLSGIDSFTKGIEQRFDPLVKLGEFLGNLLNFFYELATTIGGIFSSLQQSIVSSINASDFASFFDVLNSGMLTAILFGLKKFIASMTKITDSVGGFLGGVKGILDGVRGSLQAYQSSLKAGTLLKIAIAMGILAASLFTLSMIDSKKLASSLAAMTAMFIELFASMAVFDGLMGATGFIAMVKLTSSMIGLSVAILLLSFAMRQLGSLNWKELIIGLIGVAGLTGILVGAAKLLETSSKSLMSGALGFIVFGVAISILVSSVERLGKLEPAALAKGLIGVGVLMAALVLFMKKADLSGMGMVKTAGLILMAAAMEILADVVGKLGKFKPETLAKGLASLAIILAEITAFLALNGDAKQMMAIATSLTVLGVAVNLFAAAVIKLAELKWAELAKGLIGMGGAMAIITVAMMKFPSKNALINSLAVMDIAGSLIMLAQALTTIGKLKWNELARALIGLGGVLLMIGASFALMQDSMRDAGAIFIFSSAILLLATALKMLGSLSIGQMLTALLGIAGVLVLIGVSGSALAPLIPAILGLSAAFAVLGLAILAIGAGVLLLSTGLAALAVAGTAGTVALVSLVTGLIGLIPFLFQSLAQALVEFAEILGTAAPILADAAVKLIVALMSALVAVTPVLSNGVFQMLSDLLKSMLKFVPKMVVVGMKLLIGFLKGIADNIEEVTKTAIDIVINFIAGLTSRMEEIVDAGFELLISLIDGMTNAVDENGNRVVNSVIGLVLQIVETAGTTLLKIVASFFGIGGDAVDGFIKGIREKFSEIKEACLELGSNALEALRNALDSHSPSLLSMAVGEDFGVGFITGILNTQPAVGAAASELGNTSVNAIKEALSATVGERQKAAISANKVEDKAAKEREKINKEEYDAAVEWINERKYYNELSLNEELAAWEWVQERYLEGTEERKKADKEVYRAKKELITAEKDYAQQVIDITRAAIDERISLEEEYQDKVKSINDTLISDIEAVEDKYESALKSRTDALYDAYGLFDKVEKRGPVSGTELVQNLKDQVTEFETWQQEISKLSSKGVSSELIEELQAMGPKSLSEIQALNALSQPELDEYELLWKTKMANAKEQAVFELSDLRRECNSEIKQLNIQAEADLEEQRTIWDEKMKALSVETIGKLDQLTKDFIGKIGELTTDSQKKFAELTKTIQEEMTKPDWFALGTGVVDGMKEGMASKATALAWEAAKIATDALQAAKDALESASPSKKFMELGMYSVQGFAIGLSKYAGIANTAASKLGVSAISALKNTISNISNAVTQGIDTEPVIRPVLDLTDVEAGSLLIDELMRKGINLSTVTSKLPNISKNVAAIDASEKTVETTQKPSITFTQNNYSPTALSRLDIYRQTRNQLSVMKGVLNGV